MPDPREAKLPVWAQETLRRVRSELATAEGQLAAVDAENERLRTVIDGKFNGETDADTFLINDDTAAQLPLGKGSTVRFGGFADVTLMRSGLFVETDNRLIIRVGNYDRQVVIDQDG